MSAEHVDNRKGLRPWSDKFMRKTLKTILSYTLKPYLLHYYLRSERKYEYNNLKLTIKNGVFHPGLFYSSKLFSIFINTLPINKAKLLDLGCGSGILSLVAAEKGALVTAADINYLAVDNTIYNAEYNHIRIHCLQSDLFSQIDGRFDYIILNPPYYPKSPKSGSDYAWYCGDSHDYFERFFAQLRFYCEAECKIYMVLSDNCDIEKIQQIARLHGYQFNTELSRKFLLETNFIFKISKSSTS